VKGLLVSGKMNLPLLSNEPRFAWAVVIRIVSSKNASFMMLIVAQKKLLG